MKQINQMMMENKIRFSSRDQFNIGEEFKMTDFDV